LNKNEKTNKSTLFMVSALFFMALIVINVISWSISDFANNMALVSIVMNVITSIAMWVFFAKEKRGEK
jgi:hypothetical protein